MQAWQKHYPWCELGADITKNIRWMHARLDDHWSVEVDRHLVSIRSNDGKVLSLSGRRDGAPTALHMYLDLVGPDTFKCRLIQWHKLGGGRLESKKCTVQITK